MKADIPRHLGRCQLCASRRAWSGGEGFAVDASLIAADANKQRSIPGKEWNKKRDPATANRAVKDYLATLDEAAFGPASDVTPKFVSPSELPPHHRSPPPLVTSSPVNHASPIAAPDFCNKICQEQKLEPNAAVVIE